MTREEIVNEIKCLLSELDSGEYAVSYLTQNDVKWLNENIKALEQEPTTKNDLGVDCISRTQAQTEIEMNASRYTISKERGGIGQVEWSDQLIKVSDAVDIIRNMPSVTPQPCEDAISRKEMLNQIFYSTDNSGDVVLGSELRSRIDRLPSVTPQEPFINKPCISSGVCEHDKQKVLDKIRAEIAELSHYYPMGHDYQLAITRCLAVIDKYKSETETE